VYVHYLNFFEALTERRCHALLFAFLSGVQRKDHVLTSNCVAMVTSTPKPLVKSLLNRNTEVSSTLVQVRKDFAVALCMICEGTFNFDMQ
jgi:hypothetical protein